MTAIERAVHILGGAAVCRVPSAASPAQLRRSVKAGLPYRSLELLRTRFQLTLSETADVLDVPMRTLARRKAVRRLDAALSDRLFRLARIAALAEQTLGSEAAASHWLRAENRALAGESPLRQLDTDIGARQVEDLLGRIEHGVIG